MGPLLKPHGFMGEIITLLTVNHDMNGHKSNREPVHAHFDRGELPFWSATGSK